MWLFVLFIMGLCLVGCLSPGTIKPIANDNLKNIQNLQANNEKLYEHFKKFAEATGRLEHLHRLQAVGLRLTDFTIATGQVDVQKLTTEVDTLKKVVDQNRTIMSPEEFENFKRTLATERPVEGDIAAGFVTQKFVEQVIPIFHQTFTSPLSYRTKVTSAESYLREFYLVKSWELALADTMQELQEFLSLVREQGGLAEDHAKAFKTFSESKAHFAEIAKGLTSDTDLQTSIVKLIERRTKDPKRKAAAEELLKTLEAIDKKTSDPELKK